MTVSLNGMTLPSWASHLLHKLAPPPLLLVQAYVNTLDLDLRTDILAHADEAQAWLADAGASRMSAAARPHRRPRAGSRVQGEPARHDRAQ